MVKLRIDIKKERITAILVTLLIGTIMLLNPCYIFAQDTEDYFTFTVSKENVLLNDEIRIAVIANELNMNETIAGFRVNVEYDSSKLTLKRVDTSSQVESGTFRYHIAGDTMTGIYVCDGTAAPQLTGECMTLIFRVNEDAFLGETSVSVQIDQVVDWNAEQLPSVSSLTSIFHITPEFTKEAVLTKLIPNQGTLEPAFDPYIQEYFLQVGPEIEQILFELESIAFLLGLFIVWENMVMHLSVKQIVLLILAGYLGLSFINMIASIRNIPNFQIQTIFGLFISSLTDNQIANALSEFGSTFSTVCFTIRSNPGPTFGLNYVLPIILILPNLGGFNAGVVDNMIFTK